MGGYILLMVPVAGTIWVGMLYTLPLPSTLKILVILLSMCITTLVFLIGITYDIDRNNITLTNREEYRRLANANKDTSKGNYTNPGFKQWAIRSIRSVYERHRKNIKINSVIRENYKD